MSADRRTNRNERDPKAGKAAAPAAIQRTASGVLFALLLLALGLPVRGEESSLFGLTNLWTIHLTLSKSDWKAMEPVDRRRESGQFPPGPGAFEREYPWTTCTFECAGHSLSNVAIRFKGNSSFNMSRGSLKHPLKLDFNRGAKGRNFLGTECFVLNNNFNDATQLREAIAYQALRRAGLPAPRTAFARVFLHFPEGANHYLGLYTLVEIVDEAFLKSRFGTKKGLLLKPERLRGIEYLGENWNAYTNRYDPRTPARPADTAAFISLARLIAEADDDTFGRELPRRLDVEEALRYIAATALFANYDSFIGNGHNYYLFQPHDGRKALFIPWDFNEAFGGHPMAGPRPFQAELSILQPQGIPNRLIERLLTHTNWAAAYRKEVKSLLTGACAPALLLADAERAARVIEASVSEESEFSRDSFQRIALGRTDVELPPPPQTGQRGPRSEPTPPGSSPSRKPGTGLGPGPGGPEQMPLAQWIQLRMQNVAAELDGKRTGTSPRMQRGPGMPAGPRPPNLPKPE